MTVVVVVVGNWCFSDKDGCNAQHSHNKTMNFDLFESINDYFKLILEVHVFGILSYMINIQNAKKTVTR